MEGTIQENGDILGDDGKIYQPDMKYNESILLVCHSWARVPIKDVIGRRVKFVISYLGHGYNYNLIKL